MSLDSQAAEIELLFLRAVLPLEVAVPREPIHLSDERRDVSFSEALEFLATQHKPVRCRGRLSAGRLAISAGPPTAEQRQHLEWELSLPAGEHWRTAMSNSPNGLLRVKGGVDAITVPFKAFDAWRRNYVRTGSTVVTGPQAVEEADPAKPRWEVGIGRAGPPVESYSLDADEVVLCERCGQFLAVAVFRNRVATPVTLSLLCEHCLRAEVARELARNVGIEERMSDEESRQFLDDFLKAMQEDMRRRNDENDARK